MLAIGAQIANIVLSSNTFSSVVDSLIGKKHLALYTAYSSYHTSLTFLDTLNFTGWEKRLDLFMRWVLSMFLGNRVPDSQLSSYTHQFFAHYWGGILPYYMYFYLSYLGLLLMACYCGFIFRKVKDATDSDNGLARCFAVYVTISVVRW